LKLTTMNTPQPPGYVQYNAPPIEQENVPPISMMEQQPFISPPKVFVPPDYVNVLAKRAQSKKIGFVVSAAGRDGADGIPGRPGRDGRDGARGRNGNAGIFGSDGGSGHRGQNGMSYIH